MTTERIPAQLKLNMASDLIPALEATNQPIANDIVTIGLDAINPLVLQNFGPDALVSEAQCVAIIDDNTIAIELVDWSDLATHPRDWQLIIKALVTWQEVGV